MWTRVVISKLDIINKQELTIHYLVKCEGFINFEK